jgi:hypothetical protein
VEVEMTYFLKCPNCGFDRFLERLHPAQAYKIHNSWYIPFTLHCLACKEQLQGASVKMKGFKKHIQAVTKGGVNDK